MDNDKLKHHIAALNHYFVENNVGGGDQIKICAAYIPWLLGCSVVGGVVTAASAKENLDVMFNAMSANLDMMMVSGPIDRIDRG